MDHADHVRLLREGVATQGVGAPGVIGAPKVSGVWADLGAGEGAFTLALADLLPAGSTIHAVDRDRGALDELARHYARLERATRKSQRLLTKVGDFNTDLGLGALDGVVMANSLQLVTPRQGRAQA